MWRLARKNGRYLAVEEDNLKEAGSKGQCPRPDVQVGLLVETAITCFQVVWTVRCIALLRVSPSLLGILRDITARARRQTITQLRRHCAARATVRLRTTAAAAGRKWECAGRRAPTARTHSTDVPSVDNADTWCVCDSRAESDYATVEIAIYTVALFPVVDNGNRWFRIVRKKAKDLTKWFEELTLLLEYWIHNGTRAIWESFADIEVCELVSISVYKTEHRRRFCLIITILNPIYSKTWVLPDVWNSLVWSPPFLTENPSLIWWEETKFVFYGLIRHVEARKSKSFCWRCIRVVWYL